MAVGSGVSGEMREVGIRGAEQWWGREGGKGGPGRNPERVGQGRESKRETQDQGRYVQKKGRQLAGIGLRSCECG